ncbi:hypothetical protein PGT21_014285 [Puccinia graminis f. sp. tritici]|uniref:Secreted protein n=1 Tax=Puccinia graminis f. sp. tritici TaxID=56615 RepID=A0A5B0QN86_PUCGR|nr:hypothetical protein PGT21_014285 [Puccinia graminis f. sp. tritici]
MRNLHPIHLVVISTLLMLRPYRLTQGNRTKKCVNCIEKGFQIGERRTLVPLKDPLREMTCGVLWNPVISCMETVMVETYLCTEPKCGYNAWVVQQICSREHRPSQDIYYKK